MIKIQGLLEADLTGLGAPVSVQDGMEPLIKDANQTAYNKLAVMPVDGTLQFNLCISNNRPFVVDEMESHKDSAELLVAVIGSFVVPCAPTKIVDGVAQPDMDKAVAIRVEQGQGIIFDIGVWHWTPYAITPTSNILVGFKEDTPQNDFFGFKLEKPYEMA